MIAAASAAAPAAAGAAGILVRVPGGERHLSPDDVAAAVDRPAGTYLLRAAGTSAEPIAYPPALSLRRLVTLAGALPDAPAGRRRGRVRDLARPRPALRSGPVRPRVRRRDLEGPS